MTHEKRFQLDSGRTIVLDGTPVAFVGGISEAGAFGRTPYAIGSPALLDRFARCVVDALNRLGDDFDGFDDAFEADRLGIDPE